MMMFMFLKSAFAGTIFVTDSLSPAVVQIDTRNYFGSTVAFLPGMMDHVGGYVDMNTGAYVVVGGYPAFAAFSVDLLTGRSTFVSSIPSSVEAATFDQNLGYGVYFINGAPPFSAWTVAGNTYLFDVPFRVGGADWFDDDGCSILMESIAGTIYRMNGQNVTYEAPKPADLANFGFGALGLAYDSDTRLFWLFDSYAAMIFLIEPATWTVVGWIFSSGFMDGAAGSIDTVPQQTPELYVTGVCPGPVYITVADATPGGHVLIGSGTRAGTRRIRRGACAGVSTGIANPTPRFDLVANRYGIASTKIHTTPAMCGSVLIEALDVDSCLPTTVDPIPDPLVELTP